MEVTNLENDYFDSAHFKEEAERERLEREAAEEAERQRKQEEELKEQVF